MTAKYVSGAGAAAFDQQGQVELFVKMPLLLRENNFVLQYWDIDLVWVTVRRLGILKL